MDCDYPPLIGKMNHAEEGGGYSMHGMGPTPSEYKIVVKISINDLYFDVYRLAHQSNGKVGKDIEWSRITAIKSFQTVRGLVQSRRTNFLPTSDRHDAGISTFIDDGPMNGFLIYDYLNEKGNLMR